MTDTDLTPFWTDDDDWTGFFLQIVPVTVLPVSPRELCRQVRGRIDTDAVLYDLVAVGLSPPPEDPADAAEETAAALFRAAMPQGHFFAPRGVFAIVVVGTEKRAVDRAARQLEAWPPLRRLRTRLFTHVIEPDRRTEGLPSASVLAIADMARTIMREYERQPEVAVGEQAFLDELQRLIAARGFTLATPDRPTPPADPPPDPVPAALPPPLPGPAGPTPRPLLASVVHTGGGDIVDLAKRSPLQRFKGPLPTQVESLAAFAGVTDAVSVAYLVFVPDDEPQSRELTRRRRARALELDRLLGTAVADAGSGRSVTVAVEVLSATSPMQRHGTTLPAGELTDSILPKVPVERFDIFDAAGALLESAHRTTRSLAASNVEVVGLHVIFLATIGLRYMKNTTGPEWNRLLEQARITWVYFGNRDGLQTDSALAGLPPSPFGSHIVTDKDDAAALVKRESEVFYQWAPAADAAPAATRAPDPGRRWWPARKPARPPD